MSNRNNSYERNIRKYEMFINDKQYINKLINEVKNGKKNSNRATVEAYNRANVDYKRKSMEYYISKAKAHGGETFKLLSDAQIRAKILNLAKNYPSRPPCPTKSGKSNRRKSAEAVAQMCGGYCARQVQKVCGAVGRGVRSVTPGAKRSRTNNTNRNRINNIRNRVKEGVLKNTVNQNMSSIINRMNETQLRKLAKEKSVSIPRNLNKPK
jgi:hypothetical protein